MPVLACGVSLLSGGFPFSLSAWCDTCTVKKNSLHKDVALVFMHVYGLMTLSTDLTHLSLEIAMI